MLLVLDNAEHLLEGCVQFIDAALRRSTRLTILVTSRERLGTAGELTYRVPSLTVPAENETPTPDSALGYEAVRLFLDRARLVRPAFAITADNAAAVASICSRLDGIPLAIELAAPRLRSMSIEELSQRLDHRFALLTDGSRAALPRHRTLRSMIDWSYDLLSEAEQTMLRRLAIFAGGWTLLRAEAICSGEGIDASEVAELLTSLVDKSLVMTDERGGATRYGMLETVRQYALDRLGESGQQTQWQARHLASFLALAQESFDVVQGATQRHLIDEVASEHDNMRAALRWCAEAKLGEGLRLAVALSPFWSFRTHHLTEARGWYARLLEAVPKDSAVRDRARVLFSAARAELMRGDYGAAAELFRQSVTLCREINERRGEARGLGGLAGVALDRGQYAEAEPLLAESVALAREVGDHALVAGSLDDLGVVVLARGEVGKAFQLFEEALAMARDIGDARLVTTILRDRGRAACQERIVPLAEESLVESLRIARELAFVTETAKVLETFAELAVAKQAPERAAIIWGATEHLREEIDVPISLNEQTDYKSAVATARAALGDDVFTLTWREGREMALEDAVKYALNGEDTSREH